MVTHALIVYSSHLGPGQIAQKTCLHFCSQNYQKRLPHPLAVPAPRFRRIETQVFSLSGLGKVGRVTLHFWNAVPGKMNQSPSESMSNSNSNPAVQLCSQCYTRSPFCLNLIEKTVVVVPSFRKGARLLCTAHQSTLGQSWCSSPAKYHQSAIWQLP